MKVERVIKMKVGFQIQARLKKILVVNRDVQFLENQTLKVWFAGKESQSFR